MSKILGFNIKINIFIIMKAFLIVFAKLIRSVYNERRIDLWSYFNVI